ncbi:DJ-1/PfpI family protein [Marinigracilibium pacificum]|uniref:Glutamine amidotransferase n=1 Tax=Marinigracilibium pacificum TaxID=2729599 RepID=A0A848IRF7_9BACT|nr:DJ-1/PfpI family protein [Marinigracilibium pacificum]NMM46937.1 glutamine amidotransferase [Marinigracilibium pacificum]
MKNLYTLLIAFILFSCGKQENISETRSKEPQSISKDTLIVEIFVSDRTFNTELIAPMDIFQHTVYHTNPVMKVRLVGEKQGVMKTFEGLKITPDQYFEDNIITPDILVIPSAAGHLSLNAKNQKTIDYIKKQSNTAKYTLTLCDGAFLAAEAGLLNNKTVTTFPSDIKLFRERYPEIECLDTVSFVHDNNIITSVGGVKSYDAALYLCEILFGAEKAKNIASGLVINWNKDDIPHIIKGDSLITQL